ncbi:MAG TPA: helix-turn-helix domain-containing protein [Candidatus Evtepia excrementipullorum]|nr:helix-turn-helix transcriptional regulator [Evtepia sp.]HJB02750.1 helix-turn-helix domain-containing protein [Candidatus Evtepia excrementipullorum]
MEIGKKLRQARTQAGLTQEQAAERILVSRQTVSNWETGKSFPDLLSIVRCSELYGVSLDALLKGDDTVRKQMETEVRTQAFRRKFLAVEGGITGGAALLVLAQLATGNPVLAFITAALPWVLLGLGVACFWAWSGKSGPQ